MNHDATLSRADFDRLVQRALELDRDGDRIDLKRAEAIAAELGISGAAWDTALRERVVPLASLLPSSAGFVVGARVRVIALAGIGAGAIGGAFAPASADGVIVFGCLAVGAGAALVVDGARRGSWRRSCVELAAWWASLAAGIMFGAGAPHVDPIVFAAGSWTASALLAYLVARIMRRRTGSRELSCGSPAGASLSND